MNNEEDLQLHQAAVRGTFADDFLAHPEFKRIAEEIRSALLSEFQSTTFNQQAERDEIWRKFQSLDWIIQSFERSARDGSIAQKTLLEKVKDKLKP